jgi:chemotaxis signal transduction protein
MRAASHPQVLLFRAGDLRLGVFMADVGRLVVETTLAPVPYAHPAMAGLLDDEVAGPLPVFDLRALLDEGHRPQRISTGATVALFPTPRGLIGLRLEALHGAVNDYHDAPPIDGQELLGRLPRAASTFLSGVAVSAGTPFFFFSPEGLIGALGLSNR